MKANRDGAGDVLLRLVHRDLHEVELRREPHSIVDQLSRLDGERITDPVNLFIIKLFIIKVSEVFSHKVTQNKKNESRSHLAVHREGLEVEVRTVQDRPAGGLVAAARLHPNKTVLHDINPTNAVNPPNFVQVEVPVTSTYLCFKNKNKKSIKKSISFSNDDMI